MTNEAIIVIVLLGLIVLAARKWDTLKWWIMLGLVGLAIYTAYSMGMLDAILPDVSVPTVDFN